MDFPLKQDFFPQIHVSHDERQTYLQVARASVLALRRSILQEHDWKRINSRAGILVRKIHCIEEHASMLGYGTNFGAPSKSAACLVMCATINVNGSINEVLEALATPTTDEYRKTMKFLYKDHFLDGICLDTLAHTTNTLTTLKWCALDYGAANTGQNQQLGNDYCFVEHSGMQHDPMPRACSSFDSVASGSFFSTNGTSSTSSPASSPVGGGLFGFCIHESVVRDREIPSLAGFGLQRGVLHRTGILVFKSPRSDVVQVHSILQMGLTRHANQALIEKLMTKRVKAISRMELLLERRRLSKMQFVARTQWVSDSDRRACAVCAKSFKIHRKKHHCRSCGEVVCSACAPAREIDVANFGVASVRICTACVVHVRKEEHEQTVLQFTGGFGFGFGGANGGASPGCVARATAALRLSTNSSTSSSQYDSNPSTRGSSYNHRDFSLCSSGLMSGGMNSCSSCGDVYSSNSSFRNMFSPLSEDLRPRLLSRCRSNSNVSFSSLNDYNVVEEYSRLHNTSDGQQLSQEDEVDNQRSDARADDGVGYQSYGVDGDGEDDLEDKESMFGLGDLLDCIREIKADLSEGPGLQHATTPQKQPTAATIELLSTRDLSIICPEVFDRRDCDAMSESSVSSLSCSSTSSSTSPVRDKVHTQDELSSLRQQVAQLHRSLQEASTKLDHIQTRALVKNQMEAIEKTVEATIERERQTLTIGASSAAPPEFPYSNQTSIIMQDNADKRKSSSLTVSAPRPLGSSSVDPVLAKRKASYHALISELHEIMGLPALKHNA